MVLNAIRPACLVLAKTRKKYSSETVYELFKLVATGKLDFSQTDHGVLAGGTGYSDVAPASQCTVTLALSCRSIKMSKHQCLTATRNCIFEYICRNCPYIE